MCNYAPPTPVAMCTCISHTDTKKISSCCTSSVFSFFAVVDGEVVEPVDVMLEESNRKGC